MSDKFRPGGSLRRPAALLLVLAVAACAPSSEGETQADLRASEPATPAADRPAVDTSPRPGPATAWVIFGADTVVAEVARTEDERAQGLMYREMLDPDAGMLFVFPESAVRSFWMQNTYIALDIAYMDAQFRIVDIQQMEPMTTEPHMSQAPAMYALEVNQGWFRDHGVAVGDAPQVVFGS